MRKVLLGAALTLLKAVLMFFEWPVFVACVTATEAKNRKDFSGIGRVILLRTR